MSAIDSILSLAMADVSNVALETRTLVTRNDRGGPQSVAVRLVFTTTYMDIRHRDETCFENLSVLCEDGWPSKALFQIERDGAWFQAIEEAAVPEYVQDAFMDAVRALHTRMKAAGLTPAMVRREAMAAATAAYEQLKADRRATRLGRLP